MDVNDRRDSMKCRGLVTVVAFLVMAGVGAEQARAQATAPAAKKAASAEKKEKKEAGEAKLQMKDLPPAVKATAEAETKGATVKGVSREKEDGKTVYEVETVVNGRTRDLMIDASGKVYDVEEQLDLDKAPAPVKAAIEAKGKVVALEQATTNGKVHYEGKAKTKAGKTVSFDLDADGKPMKKQ
jgi:uncharacterized membrane protein YkoI